MQLSEFFIKIVRELVVHTIGFPQDRAIDSSRVQYFNSNANDYLYQQIITAIKEKKGFAICKFGSIELANIVSKIKQGQWTLSDYFKLIKGYPIPIYRYKEIERLGINAGFFPATEKMVDQFVQLMLTDLKMVDVLASYIYCERYIDTYLNHCTKINLDGYYAPFLYEYPWTRVMKGTRVLVIHPFAESIRTQYEKRKVLFDNTEVLPEFASLRVLKAIQSIAGNNCGFKDWFAALDWMKSEMEQEDFDIALIGCGAYGFPLTVHAKRLGKIGIHLAGWTQMLFGIYGKRWLEDQPEYSKYINKYWVRPNISEIPGGAQKVEGGCYW